MCYNKLGGTRLRVSRQALVSRCDKRHSSTTITRKCGDWVGTSLERFSARQETMGVSVSGKVYIFYRFLCFKIYFLLVLPNRYALSYLQPTTWTTGKTLPFSKVTRHSKQTTLFRMRRSLPVKRKLLPLRVLLDQGTQWRPLLANIKSRGINALLKYMCT